MLNKVKYQVASNQKRRISNYSIINNLTAIDQRKLFFIQIVCQVFDFMGQ